MSLRPLLVLAICLPASAFAALLPWDVDRVEVNQLLDRSSDNPLADDGCGNTHPVDTALVDFNRLVNYGIGQWPLVVGSQPMVSNTKPTASALPGGFRCWNQLDDWQSPHLAVFEVVFKNMFGIEIASLQLRLHYTYGGRYKGAGRYLAHVSVVPSRLSISHGYEFAADLVVEEPRDLGLPENPLASLPLDLNWTVTAPLKETKGRVQLVIRGDGRIRIVN